jgi:hypothetical protein
MSVLAFEEEIAFVTQVELATKCVCCGLLEQSDSIEVGLGLKLST